MSNRLFQGVISQMKDSVNRTVGVVGKNGTVVASSNQDMLGEVRPEVRQTLELSEGYTVIDGYTYKFINTQDKKDYIAFVEGDDDVARSFVGIVAVSLGNIKELYDEKYDKSSFIKNIMLDNILPSDVFVKSKELGLSGDTHYVVMIVKFHSHTDLLPLEIVSGMFPDDGTYYIVSVGEQDVVVVREVESNFDITEFESAAESIDENIRTEFFANVTIGISAVCESLRELARAYKEARIALEVGKVFDTEKHILYYENLGIGRLIYQLPTTLCDVFLQEVFKKGSLESLDQDTLMTVQSFFKNNLNVSETSRALFVHRNTLVYRLEKIRKITGLDLRHFDHAVTFKVALMVKKYLTNKPTKF